MRILQLTPRLPWPLMDGGAIGIFHLTKGLAELGHTLTVVSYPTDDPRETREGVEALAAFARVEIAPRPLPSRNRVLLRTIFRGAYPIARREMPEMYALLARLLQEQVYDVIHVDHSQMASYVPWLQARTSTPIVLREHNYEALLYERYAKTERHPAKRIVAKIHGARLRTAEDALLRHVNAVAAITEVDAVPIRRAAPNALVEVIPAGVDVEYFRPEVCEVEPATMLFVGSMQWDPNYDALAWFVAEILPQVLSRVPNARLMVVGGGQVKIPASIRENPAVVLRGRVPDIRDYLRPAAVMVVPLRIGGGMRIKLLEFFASGKAVVSTSIGAEGNVAEDGRELLIADEPASFADRVAEVLTTPSIRQSLGANARLLVERAYSWRSVCERFVALYQKAIACAGSHPTSATTLRRNGGHS